MGVQDNTDKIEIQETNSCELGIHGPNSERISLALWDLSLLKQVVDPICDNCAINGRQLFMALAVKIQRQSCDKQNQYIVQKRLDGDCQAHLHLLQ